MMIRAAFSILPDMFNFPLKKPSDPKGKEQ